MAKPNPFRQTPPDDEANRSVPFFEDPEFELTRGKVDFKEPLITSIPRAFSRFTRRTTAVRSSVIRRQRQVATNRKGIALLSALLLVLGAVWGGVEFTRTERAPRRVARQEKKLNLRPQPLEASSKERRAGKASAVAAKKPPRDELKSLGDKMALKAVALLSPQEPTILEPEKAEQPKTKPAAPAIETQPLYVVMPLLRVRSKPGLDGAIVRVLKQGDAVQPIGEDGNWYKIKENEYIGKKHLSATQPAAKAVARAADQGAAPRETKTAEKQVSKPAAGTAPNPAPPAVAPALKLVAIQSVKIRGAAGPKRAVVGILRKGTVVPVYEMRGVWARIGENQFVHTGNLRPASQDPTAPR